MDLRRARYLVPIAVMLLLTAFQYRGSWPTGWMPNPYREGLPVAANGVRDRGFTFCRLLYKDVRYEEMGHGPSLKSKRGRAEPCPSPITLTPATSISQVAAADESSTWPGIRYTTSPWLAVHFPMALSSVANGVCHDLPSNDPSSAPLTLLTKNCWAPRPLRRPSSSWAALLLVSAVVSLENVFPLSAIFLHYHTGPEPGVLLFIGAGSGDPADARPPYSAYAFLSSVMSFRSSIRPFALRWTVIRFQYFLM